MIQQLQNKNSVGPDEAGLPAKFIAICLFAFIAGVWATIYFYRSMCCDMKMPGGWTMSMMWMQMPGQTWFTAGINFLLMWLAMMIAMMMPAALPMFLKTRRRWTSLCYMASGYFVIWLVIGVVIYALGVELASVAMRSESFSRVVPLLLGTWLIAAGMLQFTSWKMTHLLRCRSPFGCGISFRQHEKSFRLGCKQGAESCVCCAPPMTIQLALGIMNPLMMIIVAIFIAAEKLLPRPEITTRLVGIAAIFAGVTTSIRGDFASKFFSWIALLT
jgi:predicted metal-binding membrane protein